ncbi:MAG: Do family serine endopeptidase [Holophagales bacterium]|nr:Do family serine endopeptidase [Holophagales bacterium]
MSRSVGRNTATLALLAGAVVFGMVLASGLNLTPSGAAAPSPAPGSVAEAPQEIQATAPTYLPSFADLAERVLPAVVSIEAQTIEKASPRNPHGRGQSPFDFFFGPRSPDGGNSPREFRQDAGGSGFVVSADGFVITNNHVIEGATKVRVRLDERLFDAEVKGTDPATDLALLKIDVGRTLSYLPLGDSDKLRVGDYVMAIGNPLALDHTVTVGVVSAKGRSIGLSRDSSFENFIQTDAAINRGNSGGPLVNLRGEVVGIATAMNWGAENIGFAVPVATLKAVLPQLREKGKVSRGYLGINIQNLDYDRAEAFGLDKAEGALVTRVIEDSPAAKAGIQHGDIVLSVDGRAVHETRDLIDYVSAQGPGKKVELGVLRDGKRLARTVELTERDAGGDETEAAPEAAPSGIEWLGLDYQELTPGTRESYGLPAGVDGVVVRDVAASSPLYDEGVAPGDLIVEVNGIPVRSARDFESAVSGVRAGGFVRLYLQRYDPRNSERSVSFFAIVRVP